MLRGDRVDLRPIREQDLDAFYEAHVNIANRGAFYRNQDVVLYSLLRTDSRPWRA